MFLQSDFEWDIVDKLPVFKREKWDQESPQLIFIFPLGRTWPYIWTNLNPVQPGILCAKFGWNWPSGCGEEDENVKNLRQRQRRQLQQQRRRTVDKYWSEKLTWAFGLGELKTITDICHCRIICTHVYIFLDFKLNEIKQTKKHRNYFYL